MKTLLFAVAVLLIFSYTRLHVPGQNSPLQPAYDLQVAEADIRSADDVRIGFARLESLGGSVRITIQVEKLTPGFHGVGIYGSGVCEAPDFRSAGFIFNPDGRPHGHENPRGPANGDLGNIFVDDQGYGTLEFSTSSLALDDSTISVLRSGGTSVVIHEAADDGVSQPVGNSGARVACGVISRKVGSLSATTVSSIPRS